MKKVNPYHPDEPKGHYSPGVISNGMLYISGQISVDPFTGKVAEGGAAEHTLVALENIDRVLKSAGLTRENVVQCRIFVTDMDLWDEVNRAYAQFFGSHKPARVVAPAGRLHFGCLVEIEALAEMPNA